MRWLHFSSDGRTEQACFVWNFLSCRLVYWLLAWQNYNDVEFLSHWSLHIIIMTGRHYSPPDPSFGSLSIVWHVAFSLFLSETGFASCCTGHSTASFVIWNGFPFFFSLKFYDHSVWCKSQFGLDNLAPVFVYFLTHSVMVNALNCYVIEFWFW